MALMASSLLNGERAVVLLLLLRILFSTPFSLLLFESVALSLVGFVALFVEISIESSSSLPKFSTRPGASSGILLGAITLPALMFSKLIQLSRGLPLEEVSLAGFSQLTLFAHKSRGTQSSVCTWRRHTCMYPVDARSGRRKVHAAKTDIMPPAVPSMVFPADKAETCLEVKNQKRKPE